PPSLTVHSQQAVYKRPPPAPPLPAPSLHVPLPIFAACAEPHVLGQLAEVVEQRGHLGADLACPLVQPRGLVNAHRLLTRPPAHLLQFQRKLLCPLADLLDPFLPSLPVQRTEAVEKL